ncbi:MAG: ABC transporter ATP-binding protein [Acidobacteriota bacterium]|nr:ABC transporter ATP-binding protein [Acidobacteriota bacterium]
MTPEAAASSADRSAGDAGTVEATASPCLLRVRGLTVQFPSSQGPVTVVEDLSFDLEAGRFVGLVGESGSGKSLTALSIMGLVPDPGRIAAGEVLLEGEDLLRLPPRRLRRVRGARVGMVFQEPMTALNPVLTIGFQIEEAVRLHRRMSRSAAQREAERLLDLVAIPDARRRLKDYPHQLSGGQRQRAMIAMALAGQPDLLLADEPTTALDVTIQAQILELLQSLREELGLAVLLITHDLAVVAETCERVLVMYAGELVEEAPVDQLFQRPDHPYTRGLVAASPRLGQPAARGQLPTIPGQVPEAGHRPTGCPFHPRCPEVMEICRQEVPPLVPTGKGEHRNRRRARCFLHAPEAERNVQR